MFQFTWFGQPVLVPAFLFISAPVPLLLVSRTIERRNNYKTKDNGRRGGRYVGFRRSEPRGNGNPLTRSLLPKKHLVFFWFHDMHQDGGYLLTLRQRKILSTPTMSEV